MCEGGRGVCSMQGESPPPLKKPWTQSVLVRGKRDAVNGRPYYISCIKFMDIYFVCDIGTFFHTHHTLQNIHNTS